MKRIILITGASSGIGLETTKVLEKNQNNIIYACSRHIGKLDKAHSMALDVTNYQSCQKVVRQIIKEQGHLDVLINCAGYGSMGPVEEVPINDAKKQINVNVFGIARLSQLIIPYMRKQHSGKIINISSIAGRIPLYFGDWYSASKFAVEGLSDDMRTELKPFGIRVVLIEPGSIRSQWGMKAMYSLDKATEGTPYLQYTNRMVKFLHHQKDAVLTASSPHSVARIIRRAVKAKHPKSRYLMGRFSHISIIAKKLMPTFLFDKIIRRL